MRKNLTRTADPLRDTAQQPFHIEILYLTKCTDMKKYEKAQMEVIEFENEDVITTSGQPGFYPSQIPEDGNEDMW